VRNPVLRLYKTDKDKYHELAKEWTREDSFLPTVYLLLFSSRSVPSVAYPGCLSRILILFSIIGPESGSINKREEEKISCLGLEQLTKNITISNLPIFFTKIS
jgi:hypothetical protein